MGEPVLEARGIHKRFPGVQALADVSLAVHAGEVHALVGANGAGKSTLVKILAGALRPDRGQILLDGRPVSIASPREAFRLGIALIHQEPNVVPQLDVVANIFLGREWVRGPWPGRPDRERMRQKAQEVLGLLGTSLDPSLPVGRLGIAQKQVVEMARALVAQSRVLILDEPTAALTPGEVERLFGLIGRLRAQGVGIIYISHRLEELPRVADRVTVLRDGRVVAHCSMAEASPTRLVAWMVGEAAVRHASPTERSGPAAGTELVRLEGCGRRGRLHDIHLVVRRGEVVGLAGLLGSGRTEVALGLMGIQPFDRGRVLVEGRPVQIRSPRMAKALGFALIPEDRRGEGLCGNLTVRENAAHAVLGRLFPYLWVHPGRERQHALRYMETLGIVPRRPEALAGQLSGGNQQKLVLAKWLATGARLFIFDEPTRGIDVAAKAEMHRLIRQLAEQGAGVLLISSELPEVLALSDRIYVMREGTVVAELAAGASQQDVLLRATGAA